jgi:hypothetical protein
MNSVNRSNFQTSFDRVYVSSSAPQSAYEPARHALRCACSLRHWSLLSRARWSWWPGTHAAGSL